MKSERHQAILDLLARRRTAPVGDIAGALGVSAMTIRRDLAALADEGLVVRVRGGARLAFDADARSADGVDARRVAVSKAGRAAMLAAQRVHPGDSIFLGGGRTLELMCDYLPKSDIRVVTNSAQVFSLLADGGGIELSLIGGIYLPRTRTFAMPGGAGGILDPAGSKAFVSCTGVFGNEVFGDRIDDGAVLSDALDGARERYLVIDEQVIGRRGYHAFTALDRMDAVFMNPDAPRGDVEAIASRTKVVLGP